jgi:tetratricopeptide (TPR) repeat protein
MNVRAATILAMDADDPLAAALTAFHAGRMEEARRSAEAIWAQTADARAAGLLALVETAARRYEAALGWNRRARERKPSVARYALQEARLAGLMGNHGAAFESLVGLLRERPQMKAAWLELAGVARNAGRGGDAIAECIRAFDADPTRHAALLALLHLVSDEPGGATAAAPIDSSPRRSISIVVCSNRDERFAAMKTSYEGALEGWPHEVVRIADATSLAEGYTRGMAASTGELIIFSHDDVEFVTHDLGPRLSRRLAHCDVLGVAGATRATGPAWPYAGWPFLHGAVIYPDDEGYRVAVYSRTVPIAHGIRVMDGVFLAMRREVALSIGWDAETCDGFHGYDVDFTLRAAKAGLRLAAATDLGVVHQSIGSFDKRWATAARKLVARHPELNGERASETGPVARRVPDAAHALALIDNWARMSATA